MIPELRMNVGTVCIREVVIVHGAEPLTAVARLMREHHVGDVIVVEQRGAKNYPTGIVTDRDIVVGGFAVAPERLSQLIADDLVTRPLVTVRERDAVDGALELMRTHGVRRLPVVDDSGVLVGILAFDDLLESFSGRLAALASVVGRENRMERDYRP